jgi:short-subunit dehydrogenase
VPELVAAPLPGRTRASRRLARAVAGKRILVTGASSGIGHALALELAAAGGNLLLVARRAGRLAAVAAEVEARGGSALTFPSDLSLEEDVARVTREVLETAGGVDVLVNNAGRSIRRGVDASYDRVHDYERCMQLNYFAAVRLCLAFLPGMAERGDGHVINVSSIGLQTSMPRFSAYNPSKAAVDAFARSIGPELRGRGVAVTTVYMPLVRTRMSAPTTGFRRMPSLDAAQAGRLLARAIVRRPTRVSSGLGAFGQLADAISPRTVEAFMARAFNFPDSRLPGDARPRVEEARRVA